MPADHTIKAVFALLAADPGVSRELRPAIVSALESGGSVNLRGACRVLGVSKTTLWRMRKQGRLNLRTVGPRWRSCMVSLESVINQGAKT